MAPEVGWEWLGRVPYGEMLERQRARRDAILEGSAPEVLWLLEHDPVVTVGRRGGLDPEFVRRPGAPPVFETERGGLATYHGPGQLVGYLLVDVARRGGGVRTTVAGVEEGVAAWLRERGIVAGARPGHPGVWVGPDKICAVGLHFRRGVSMHGFALNLTVDLGGFGGFVPCGISDGGVTSLVQLGGPILAPMAAAPTLAGRVLSALERSWSRGAEAGRSPSSGAAAGADV